MIKKDYKNYIDNIEFFIDKDNAFRKRLYNLRKYQEISFDFFDRSKKYYFYPLHLEPEAVVLYWGENLYTNQVKLIENIAAQLPPNTFLYVKDHPHYEGYRSVEDYKRIKQIPNVKLLHSKLPGKEIIKNSIGVITINGTSGFEALLLNKHVIIFGNAFYQCSERVKKIYNIRELKNVIYSLKDSNYEDDEELYIFIKAYLSAQKKGFTSFYGGTAKKLKINIEDNSTIIAEGFKNYFISD